jgi:hypothetical protein
LDFGLRESMRADEKLTAFVELDRSIREFGSEYESLELDVMLSVAA